MGLTKLDTYDYVILPGVIRVNVDGINDPDLVDILSSIDNSRGRIYVEGRYYSYLDNYQLFTQGSESYIELDVIQIA